MSTTAQTKPYVLLDAQGGKGYRADWSDASHHYRRLVTEFLGTYGFLFVLSGGAATLHAAAHPAVSNTMTVVLLTLTAALWLVIAIYALGDVSAHFNRAMTFAFALRGDMSWRRAVTYWVVQCGAATAGSATAAALFGRSSGLAAVHVPDGQALRATRFEALLTMLFVLLVLAMSRGPKLNGPFTPISVGAYVISLGTVGHINLGAVVQSKSVQFREDAPHSKLDWHKDPEPRYVIFLAGVLEFTTRSGDVFTVSPGEVLIATDNTGSGHSWRIVNDQPWVRAYVVFEPDADVQFIPDAE